MRLGAAALRLLGDGFVGLKPCLNLLHGRRSVLDLDRMSQRVFTSARGDVCRLGHARCAGSAVFVGVQGVGTIGLDEGRVE